MESPVEGKLQTLKAEIQSGDTATLALSSPPSYLDIVEEIVMHFRTPVPFQISK